MGAVLLLLRADQRLCPTPQHRLLGDLAGASRSRGGAPERALRGEQGTVHQGLSETGSLEQVHGAGEEGKGPNQVISISTGFSTRNPSPLAIIYPISVPRISSLIISVNPQVDERPW